MTEAIAVVLEIPLLLKDSMISSSSLRTRAQPVSAARMDGPVFPEVEGFWLADSFLIRSDAVVELA